LSSLNSDKKFDKNSIDKDLVTLPQPSGSPRKREKLLTFVRHRVLCRLDVGNLCRQKSRKIDPKGTKHLEILLSLAGGIFIALY
jgi:hypothetical protein